MAPDTQDTERLLAAIGLGQPEARRYEAVVACPGATADELTVHARMPARRARAILGLLASHGLVSRTAHHPGRYVPAPPDVAIEPRKGVVHQAVQVAADVDAALFGAGPDRDRLTAELRQIGAATRRHPQPTRRH